MSASRWPWCSKARVTYHTPYSTVSAYICTPLRCFVILIPCTYVAEMYIHAQRTHCGALICGVPSKSAARVGDLKCRPLRKNILPPQKFLTTFFLVIYPKILPFYSPLYKLPPQPAQFSPPKFPYDHCLVIIIFTLHFTIMPPTFRSAARGD